MLLLVYERLDLLFLRLHVDFVRLGLEYHRGIELFILKEFISIVLLLT